MTDLALVIGIDQYLDEGWRLDGAVRDAIRFARWVTEPDAGRATPDTLTLLLSSRENGPPIDPPKEPLAANRENLEIHTDNLQAGDGSQRLWFFYAGHGVAPRGGGPGAGPVLIPSDVRPEHLESYVRRAVTLDGILATMQARRPLEQFYFVDACRGIVESDDAVTEKSVFLFDIDRIPQEVQDKVSQAVVLATTAGRLANEVGGHGLFSKALLQGLSGFGPKLTADPRARDWVLNIMELQRFIGKRVRAGIEDLAKRHDRELEALTQVPSPLYFNQGGDAAVARFPRPRPKATLSVFVQPRREAVEVVYLDPARDYLPSDAQTPPAEFELACDEWTIEAQTSGERLAEKTFDLFEDRHEVLELSPAPSGLESIDGGRAPATRSGPGDPLIVAARDRRACIQLLNKEHEVVATDRGRVEERFLEPGPYRAVVTVPGAEPVERSFFVGRGPNPRIDVAVGRELPAHLLTALTELGIACEGGYSMPSEAFEWSLTRTASVLAWAAWAARFPADSGGRKLRSIEVDPLDGAADDAACFQVLVGDAAGGLLDSLQIAVGPTGGERPVECRRLAGLPGIAVQAGGEIEAAGQSVLVEAEPLNAASFPLPVVPGWVSVLVLAREGDGGVDIHRYLHPLRAAAGEFSDLVRRQEEGFRGLAERRPFLPGEAEELLGDPALDPLALAVAGYRLAREDRLELLDQAEADAESPLESATRRAPGLPDLGVLRTMALLAEAGGWPALAGRDLRGTLDARADEIGGGGFPLVAEGAAFFSELITRLAAAAGYPPPIPRRPLIAGTVWTRQDARRRVVSTPDAIAVAELDRDTTEGALLARVAASTARVESPDATSAITGSGFVVAPGLLATAEHAAGTHNLEVPADGEPLAAGWKAVFSPEVERTLEEVLTRARTGPGIPPSWGPWGILRLTVLRCAAHVDPVPAVDLGWEAPVPGQHITIIGHPSRDPRVPAEAVAGAFGSTPVGEKVVTPGTVDEVFRTYFRYRAFTLNGASGGPVVDLATGRVIGFHFGGDYRNGVKYGLGVQLSSLRADPIWQTLGIDAPPPELE